MAEKVFIHFTDSIAKKQYDAFISACSEAIYKYSPKELHIIISSHGGNINLALVLYSYLRSLDPEIVMHGSGNIDSAAVNLFLAGDKRYATADATFLLHGATRTFGKDQSFTAEKLYSEFISLQKDQKKVIANILTNTNYTEKGIENDLALGVTLDANEAKNKGIISDIKEYKISREIPYFQVSNYMKRD